jgi:hypothetical protein
MANVLTLSAKKEGRMRTYAIRSLLVCGMVVTVGGCSHYYRVTDPGSGKSYYTQDIHEGRGGAVKIKDDRTRSTVTLQSSEVREISADEYEAELNRTDPIVTRPSSSATTQPPVATQSR